MRRKKWAIEEVKGERDVDIHFPDITGKLSQVHRQMIPLVLLNESYGYVQVRQRSRVTGHLFSRLIQDAPIPCRFTGTIRQNT